MRWVLLGLIVGACTADRAGLAGVEDAAVVRTDGAAGCVARGETCNAIDDDCDGTVDEVPAETCGTDVTLGVCEPGAYLCVAGVRSCEGAVLPAAEACSTGLDEDCDGAIDEDCGCTPGETSACGISDRGECRFGTRACADGGTFGECLGAIEPSAESCNGLDDDCDGETDEALRQPFYRDADGDGFGSLATVVAACSPPEGFVADARDCNDTCRECYPGREEACDALDNDCDGVVDDGLVQTVWRDADGDGFGDRTMALEACDVPGGYTRGDADCNDSDANVRPNAFEACNARDDNCDGTVDDGCMADCNRIVRGSSRYHFCRAGRRWTEARDFCGTLGAALVTIDDGTENGFVRQQADAAGGGDWWTGMNDLDDEGEWEWASGSDAGYRNWGSGEPNNLANEDCGSMRPDARWNDSDCRSSLRFACEAEL